MHPNLRKASVNWIDGMKVNKKHFQQTEDWALDHLKDIVALSLTDHNYGLLPGSEDIDASLDYQIEVEQTQFIKITLMACRAITRGGVRIEITPYVSKQFSLGKSHLEVVFDLKGTSNQQYDIVVTVDPFTRVAAGDPDPEEHPLRHPSSLPKYSVDVIPSNHINTEEFSTYHLTIGKFRVVAGEVQNENYIPPCTRISSHPTLLEFYRDFEKQLNEAKQHLTQYIKKSRSLGSHSENHNVLTLTESMLMNIAVFEDEFQMEIPNQSPSYLYIYFKRLIRLISTELNCMPEDERLMVYNTFNQSFTAGTFENVISSVLHLKYTHRDIFQVMDKLFQETSRLMEIISRLPFTSQSSGQHYQKQEEIPAPEKPRTSGAKIFRGGQQIKR
ncbi:type VI secretion system baseplate subunit TssK [Catalinimonas niigatensis]|uniref:type VI secretion system baseplate subunit TssK n=1 Tax=Catalinimonas niigatensis TaxID=1397264 RepID=UPI0026667C17|nr:type VI secretion system baseplate subunit TssK [Catalinimonas niigatensis]WPP49129.1 hypothetical protein PZB72_20900 [Catalinimonas niigatensis]